MNDPRPRGFDDGYFKGTANKAGHNFDALRTCDEFKFALFGFGWGIWTEPGAQWYLDEAARKGLLAGSWHFPYRHLSAAQQVAAWVKTPKAPWGPRWVDYERSKYYDTIPSATQLMQITDMLEQHDGEKAGIYSRKELIDNYLATMPDAWFIGRPFWLAQYGADRRVEDMREVILPKRVLRAMVWIHQTADKVTPPPGYTPKALSQDIDRWVGPMPLETI